MKSAATVEKAVDILFHLHACDGPRGVSAIGRALGLPKSSAHRLLAALGRRGLVEQTEEGRYRPGTALIALGLGVLEREPVVEAARPVLEARSRVLDETVFLVAARARELVVLDKSEGSGFLRASPQVGARVPVHATAVGKLYLALAPDQVDVAPEPEAFTPDTLVEPSSLEAAIADTRTRGWAQNDQEWIRGLSVLAAPIVVAGRLVAAVAVGAASARVSELGEEHLANQVLDAAAQIAARLTTGPTSRAAQLGERDE
jgi:IclR family acetate operon transcriptional repressor